MSDTPAEPTIGDTGYIRGGGGVQISAGRLVRFLAGAAALVLIALAIETAVSAANQNSRAAKLRNNGIPVEVTITGCTGISSGIAQAVQYYQCRGTYTLDGQRYNEVIGAIRASLPPGQTVPAIAVRTDPALVTTATTVKDGSYIPTIVLGALGVMLLLGLLRWRRRSPR
ncbi:MAG TPA: hypothetical protein VLX59_09110 [Acidimicrobiales bacterium]|nr:hypothetical protein [Acidimicrobiales bacterium]